MVPRAHYTRGKITVVRCAALALAACVSVAYAGGVPQINSLSESTLSRSGRLLIFGSNFGSSSASGQVLIDGLDAIATTWTNTEIHAYVPEGSSLGSVAVQIVTSGGSSAAVTMEVTLRQANGRVHWRFQSTRGSLLARFGCPVGTGDPSCDAADVNGDGEVDPLDGGFVLARFGLCR